MVRLGHLAPIPGARKCWKKVKFKSLGAAEAQLRSLLRNPHVQNAERLNAYKCPHCDGFHVGRVKAPS